MVHTASTHAATTTGSPIVAQAQAVYNGTLGTVLHLSSDALALIGIACALTAYIFWRGKDEGVTNLLALIVAGFAFSVLPALHFLTSLSGSKAFWASLAMLAVFFLVARFCLGKVVAVLYPNSTLSSWGSAVLLAILTTALIAVYTSTILPIGSVYTFSPQVSHLLMWPYALVSVLGLSLVSIWFLNRR